LRKRFEWDIAYTHRAAHPVRKFCGEIFGKGSGSEKVSFWVQSGRFLNALNEAGFDPKRKSAADTLRMEK